MKRSPLSILGFCFLVSSCNPDDYFDVNTLIAGNDAYCSRAQDQASCEALPKCQPAFEDMESDVDTPIYSACIANPPAPDDGSVTTPDDGTTTPPDDGTTADNGGDPGNPSDPSNPDDPTTADDDVPTVEEAWQNNCAGLSDDYLYIKHIIETKSKGGGSKKTTTKRQVKVKVCHQTGNMSAHTIIVACPALRPHVNHHDDYLGACKVE